MLFFHAAAQRLQKLCAVAALREFILFNRIPEVEVPIVIGSDATKA